MHAQTTRIGVVMGWVGMIWAEEATVRILARTMIVPAGRTGGSAIRNYVSGVELGTSFSCTSPFFFLPHLRLWFNFSSAYSYFDLC